MILLPTPFVHQPFCWLMEEGPNKFGVHADRGWCVCLHEYDNVRFFDSESACMALLPVLEIESSRFFDFIQTMGKVVPEYWPMISVFPKELLLKHAFHSFVNISSGYWPELALSWLVDDYDLQPVFENELNAFLNKKSMPQKSRQMARKIVRSIMNRRL